MEFHMKCCCSSVFYRLKCYYLFFVFFTQHPTVLGSVITRSLGDTGKLQVAKDTPYYLRLDLIDLPENQLRQNLALMFKSDSLGLVSQCDEGYIQAVGIFDGTYRTNLTGNRIFKCTNSRVYLLF